MYFKCMLSRKTSLLQNVIAHFLDKNTFQIPIPSGNIISFYLFILFSRLIVVSRITHCIAVQWNATILID